jgi:hypothetical protein
MEFTREELQVIFQALNLAEAYYKDPNAHVHGMYPLTPTDPTRTKRLTALEPVINRIMIHAETLT